MRCPLLPLLCWLGSLASERHKLAQVLCEGGSRAELQALTEAVEASTRDAYGNECLALCAQALAEEVRRLQTVCFAVACMASSCWLMLFHKQGNLIHTRFARHAVAADMLLAPRSMQHSKNTLQLRHAGAEILCVTQESDARTAAGHGHEEEQPAQQTQRLLQRLIWYHHIKSLTKRKVSQPYITAL